MDYEGKYFPDEEEKELSKSQIRRKKFFKYSLYSIIILVYVIAFIVIFGNCEHSIYGDVTFSERARAIYKEDPSGFVAYEVHSQIFMNHDGSVQLDKIVFSPTANEMEFGIKYNKSLIVDGKAPEFSLTDTHGNIYQVCFTKEAKKGRYVYSRVSFENVSLNLEDNIYINPELKDTVQGEGEDYESLKFSLVINYSSEAEPETLDVFSPTTAIEPYKYG